MWPSFGMTIVLLSTAITVAGAFQAPTKLSDNKGSTLLRMTANKQANKATKSSSSSSRQNRIRSLMEWADSVEILSASRLELRATESAGLGWFAKMLMEPASNLVLTVPAKIALTVDCPGDGPDDSEARALVRGVKDLPWYVQMAVYLHKLDKIDGTKGDIQYRPWLDSLQRQFDTPLHWNNLDELQYKYMEDAVDRQRKQWKTYYDTLSQQINGLSWDDFVWACESARSRAFSGGFSGSAFNPSIYAFTLLLVTVWVGLGIGTLEQAANGAGIVFAASVLNDFVLPKVFKKKRYVICPMIDMANHKTKGNIGEVSFEFFANVYSLASPSNKYVRAGEELCISYGDRSNDQFLQYYGFVESGNPNDVYVMPPLREWDIDALEKQCGRTFASGRLAKLDRAGLLGSATTVASTEDALDDDAANIGGGVVITRRDGIDPAVLQALRALVSTDAEWDAAGEAIGNFAESINPDNERCAKIAARTAIEMELESKPTKLDDDIELLKNMETVKSMDASIEDMLAVRFRIEKKKVLKRAIKKLQD